MGKRKGKGISLLTGPGGVQPSQGARGHAGRRPSRPTEEGNDTGTVLWARAHLPVRRGADDIGSLTGEGANRPESTAGEVPRRFSIAVPVSGGRGGGLAWTGVGDHGGGDNLVRGCSERPVHGEVAGSTAVRSLVRPSSATGKAKWCLRTVGRW
jgi:hypothetical protein